MDPTFAVVRSAVGDGFGARPASADAKLAEIAGAAASRKQWTGRMWSAAPRSLPYPGIDALERQGKAMQPARQGPAIGQLPAFQAAPFWPHFEFGRMR
jgi:hypothetical protein